MGGAMTAMEAAGNGRTIYDRWLDAYEAAYRDQGALQRLACPTCGEVALQLVFVIDAYGDGRATSAFWCKKCLWGIAPNSTSVPSSATAVLRGEEEVPDYRLVLDDGR
ncbi:hypothetical protein GCM10009741_75350 [Kribbella lupini]|uniref:Uncharacterized protein n=1 Tax=Kribbella lupini TaxID=291602 RepID=A0ABN2CIV0_9ACTN